MKNKKAEDELGKIKDYIFSRLAMRDDIGDLENKSLAEIVSEIIDTDELFYKEVESQGIYTNEGLSPL